MNHYNSTKDRKEIAVDFIYIEHDKNNLNLYEEHV